MENFKLLNLLLTELEAKKIIKNINQTSTFYDEPQFYIYSSTLNNKSEYFLNKRYQVKTFDNVCGGTSANSRSEALLKCLSEIVERFCLFCYEKRKVIFSSYLDLNKKALDPFIFIKNESIRGKKIGWVSGFDLIDNSSCLIPAQITYLRYIKDQIKLAPSISTGAASGLSYESTLLRGIYEVVERDSFMSIYLNRIKAPKIYMENIKDKTINKILNSCRRYNLEPHLFNITTDLDIPSFLTILIDTTGLGPLFTIGTKSSLNIKDAIIGSIMESFSIRQSVRMSMLKNKIYINPKIPKIIKTIEDRILFWSTTNRLSKLDFLLSQKPKKFNIPDFDLNEKDELKTVKRILLKNKLQTYYVDITLPLFKKLNYIVYKVIIPQLQPMYINEELKELRITRLKEVSRFFGQKKFVINQIPHPFL